MRTDELDFELPPDLIAQSPVPDRAASRLLHYRAGEAITHHQFSDLPKLLRPNDLLLFNNAKVVPARFLMKRSTGGLIEGLFLEDLGQGRWQVLLRNASHILPTETMEFDAAGGESPAVTGLSACIAQRLEAGEHILQVSDPSPALTVLWKIGRMPLPPYIKRLKRQDQRDEMDRNRYQTVYAANPGSVAAPTAGLHFTPALLDELREMGIEETFVTLHVGMGTFKPVTADTLDAHTMHTESYEIESPAAEALNRAQRDGRRIVCVGTTSARVLESQPADQPIAPVTGQTSIFITPGYSWKRTGALITNFHLPRSTLIALVAARVGLETQRRIYAEAIEQKYRFFSYGDSSFLE